MADLERSELEVVHEGRSSLLWGRSLVTMEIIRCVELLEFLLFLTERLLYLFRKLNITPPIKSKKSFLFTMGQHSIENSVHTLLDALSSSVEWQDQHLPHGGAQALAALLRGL